MTSDPWTLADRLFAQLRALLDALYSEDEYAIAVAVGDSEELLDSE